MLLIKVITKWKRTFNNFKSVGNKMYDSGEAILTMRATNSVLNGSMVPFGKLVGSPGTKKKDNGKICIIVTPESCQVHMSHLHHRHVFATHPHPWWLFRDARQYDINLKRKHINKFSNECTIGSQLKRIINKSLLKILSSWRFMQQIVWAAKLKQQTAVLSIIIRTVYPITCSVSIIK